MLRTGALTSPRVAWRVAWGAVPGIPEWARTASHRSGAYLGNPPPRLHPAVAAVPHPRQPAQIRLDAAALPPALGRHPRRRRAPGRARALPRTHHVRRRRRSPQRPLGALSGVGRRADWTPIGALTSCFLLTHRGQHRALNNTDRRGNPLIWLDCGGQQSVLDNKPGCTRWRARSGSRHGRRERDLAGGVGAARPVSIAVSMTFPMRSAAASTSRSLTWA